MRCIIGKLLYICTFLGSFYISASINLKIVDAQSQPLSRVGIGQPFFVEVILDGDSVSKGVPDIEGMERLKGQRVGYRMETINGVSSITYTYRVRVDSEGSYVVGPARIGSYESSVLKFEASRDACYDIQGEQSQPDAILRYDVDKKDAFIGEKIGCHLKFLYRGDVTLKNIGRPDPIKFEQENACSPEVGVEEYNGKQYQVCYWHWNIYPCQEGEQVIPAYSAEYIVRKKHRGFWAHFGQFMQDDLRSIYSNGVRIIVHALPPAPYPVCLLGKDIVMRAFVDTVEVTQSEAVLLTLEFEGSIDCQKPILDSLTGLPSELKWYRSHVKGADSDNSRMRIEFIIQALKAGNFEIPAQRVCYFDTDERVYHEIETQPISITVKPSVDNFVQLEDAGSADVQTEDATKPRSYSSDVMYYNRRLRESSIPWWFFFSMLGLIFVAFIYNSLVYSIKVLLGITSEEKEQQLMFIKAEQAIIEARKDNNSQQLYSIFHEFIMKRFRLSPEKQSFEETMRAVCDRLPMIEEKEKWYLFYTNLLSFSFGREVDLQSFAMALKWLERINTLL